ncbi:MAG TPA: response regulator, partial [Acidobacteria bacterium]|nr:response regulator [Acidobacteriota bacterium]
ILKKGLCAVLAEDEPAILMALDEVLSSRGFTTVPCTDGLSALEAVRSKRPALAVFDVNMPGLTGTDLALRLRMVDVMDELRILVVTGRDDLRTRGKILASGVDDFIIKPFDLRTFLDAVDRLMEVPGGGWLQRDAWYRVLPHDDGVGYASFVSGSGDRECGCGRLLSRLARSFDERSLHQPYHMVQVAHLALLVARTMGLDETAQTRVRNAGLVHDLGLMFVPDAVVTKPGPLSDEEWTRIRQHPEAAEDVLAGIPELAAAAPAVLHHHERWDGSGYPEGLAGDSIPVEARILAVADAFSAMTTRRAYADPLTVEDAAAELEAKAGSQFDPSCVAAFHTAAGI